MRKNPKSEIRNPKQPANHLTGAKLIDVGGWKMLPCAANVCQECATDHRPELPHNQQSLFWLYKFYGEQNRWPTWADAMAHCTPEMKAKWTKALAERGVKV